MDCVADEEEKAALKPLDYRRPVSDLRIDAVNPEFYSKWLFGAIAPIGVASYGVICVVKRVAEFRGESQATMTLHGLNAIAFGMTFIAAAIFMHCRLFWGEIYQTTWILELCEILAVLVIVISLVTLIVRIGVYGIA
jgi:hypothetical protein